MKRKASIYMAVALLAWLAYLALASGGPPEASPSARAAQVDIEPIRSEGRVAAYPDAWITLSSEREGTLTRLNCREKAVLKKGDVVAVLQGAESDAALAEALAQRRAAEADARLAGLEAKRARELMEQGFHSRQAYDRAEEARASALARENGAVANERRLAAVLAKTVIRAPFTATVVERPANQGEWVRAGEPICGLANLGRLRIEAEVYEFDGARVRVGDPARIIAEGYPGDGWAGRIEEVPDIVSRPRLRQQDPAKPMDARVLVVKIAPSGPLPVKLGQRVEVRIGRL